MYDVTASDWEIRYRGSSSAPLAIWSQETAFELSSLKEKLSIALEFSGLTLQIGFKFKDTRAKAVAQIAENSARMQNKGEHANRWPLKVFQPFCANDIDWAHGIVAFYSLGAGAVFASGLRGHETALRFFARSNKKGVLFEHPGLGIPLDEGAIIPRATTTSGIWKIR